MHKYELNTHLYRGLEDFTFYERVVSLKDLFGDAYSEEVIPASQWDETVRLKPRGLDTYVDGRLNLSRCFAGESVSCSFRATDRPPDKDVSDYHVAYHVEESGYNPSPPRHSEDKLADVKAENETPEQKSEDIYLNSIADLCDVVYKRIFPYSQEVRGLIIISGATASGKSNIARGLIYTYLSALLQRIGSGRRPHLVTCEDPIDKYWAKTSDDARITGIDYTPRELTKDVNSLTQAVTAALRQTPKVFFVGETRQSTDWKVLLQFASTGHLCITTSHAGSLTEAMGQLFNAVNASTPAQRSEVANRILALVHLRSDKVLKTENEHASVKFTIPAIWVRSAISTKTIMADGLTSLLPYRDAVNWDELQSYGTAGELGCLGRSWFAERLLAHAGASVEPTIAKEIERLALSWDLEGL